MHCAATVNASGDSANLGTVGPEFHGFLSVGSHGMVAGILGVPEGGRVEFFFQGCGPTATVLVGFSGDRTSTTGVY